MTFFAATPPLEDRILSDGGQAILDVLATTEVTPGAAMSLRKIVRLTGQTKAICESRLRNLIVNGYATSPSGTHVEVMTDKTRLTRKGWEASSVERPFWMGEVR